MAKSQILKDPEVNTSQLNRLGETLQATSLQSIFVGAQLSAASFLPAQVLAAGKLAFAPAQVLADG